MRVCQDASGAPGLDESGQVAAKGCLSAVIQFFGAGRKVHFTMGSGVNRSPIANP
jgi:hypothetical protein